MESMLLLKARTYKPWIGNCLLKLQSYSERSRNVRLPPRSYHLSESTLLCHCVSCHCVSIDKDDNFIHRDYRPINIRYIFFSCYLHFSLNVCCNHSIFPFIIVINKNLLNRRAPAVKYDHTISSGGLWPLPGQR